MNQMLDASLIEKYCEEKDLYYNYFGDVAIIYKDGNTFQIEKKSDNEFHIHHISIATNKRRKFKTHLHKVTRDLPYALYQVIDTYDQYTHRQRWNRKR